MFHACVQKFDMTKNLKDFAKKNRTKQVLIKLKRGKWMRCRDTMVRIKEESGQNLRRPSWMTRYQEKNRGCRRITGAVLASPLSRFCVEATANRQADSR